MIYAFRSDQKTKLKQAHGFLVTARNASIPAVATGGSNYFILLIFPHLGYQDY